MKRVLIVEPHAQTQALARAAVQAPGTEVVAVADATAARALLYGPLHFDLVVAAAELPGETSCALLEGRRPETPPTPWLILCREDAVRTKIRALERGAEAVLTPPVFWREFAALANRLLKEGAAQAEPKRRYNGILSAGVCRDILRHALEDGQEGRLEAENAEGTRGHVLFSQGALVAARVGAISGEAAVRVLTGWQAGRFTLLYEPIAPSSSPMRWTCLDDETNGDGGEAVRELPPEPPPRLSREIQVARRPIAPVFPWKLWMGGAVAGAGILSAVLWWMLEV